VVKVRQWRQDFYEQFMFLARSQSLTLTISMEQRANTKPHPLQFAVILLEASLLILFCLSLPADGLAGRPNVVLVTLDTTRADRVGFLGSKRGLTPNLDDLAQRSVVFTRAYSVVPLTTASHATILTGTFPEFNGVNDFGKPLPSEVPYLPDLLHERGYQTAAFVGSLVLDPIGGTAPGFDRGFSTYDAGFRMRRRGEDRFQTVERRGADVVGHAVKWLSKRTHKPFFLWVHLYDAHDPYDPPAPYSTLYADSLYDGEIAYADACVGKLIAALRLAGLYDGTLIALMADHGEALGQHGEQTHGVFLYDETIHVPLLFKLPLGRYSNRRVETRVSLVDVMPTVLEIASIPIPNTVQGKSLLETIEETPQAAQHSADSKVDTHSSTPLTERPIYAETDYPHRAFGWRPLRSVRTGKYLFIKAPTKELYDESIDPEASHNLAVTAPAISDTLSAQLDEFHRKLSNARIRPSPANDAQQAEQLSALGYVSSGSSAATEPREEGADPKERIEIANLMHDALMEVEDGRYEEAVPQLERVLAQQPQITVAELQLGIAFARLKKLDKALPLLQSAVKRQPDSGMAHYELGLTLFDAGDLPAAAPEFAFAVEHAPRWADAHFSLAAVYARIDRVPDAMTELTTALELNPEHYRANLLRGRILSLQGHAAEALPNLEKAAQVEPNSVEAHLFLADAYSQTGQQESALRERAAAERLKSAPRS
jgi:arylsulfatase A-like enzyme/Tfp pilus assembly protein PilF